MASVIEPVPRAVCVLTSLPPSLQAATLGSQEGAFENVRLSFQGDQGQQLRQLLSTNAVRRVAMCALSSVKGHRQHLAVNHDKGKVQYMHVYTLYACIYIECACKHITTVTKVCTIHDVADTFFLIFPANES